MKKNETKKSHATLPLSTVFGGADYPGRVLTVGECAPVWTPLQLLIALPKLKRSIAARLHVQCTLSRCPNCLWLVSISVYIVCQLFQLPL
jgi:hypothetical protein